MRTDQLSLLYGNVALYPLLNVIYELSDDIIIVFDLSERLIVDVNNQFTMTFNVTKEQVFADFSKLTNLFTDENELFNICDILLEFGSIKDYKIFLKTENKEQLAMTLSGQTQKVLNNNYAVCLLKDNKEKKNSRKCFTNI